MEVMDDISYYKNISDNYYCLSPEERGYVLGTRLKNLPIRLWMLGNLRSQSFGGQDFLSLGKRKAQLSVEIFEHRGERILENTLLRHQKGHMI